MHVLQLDTFLHSCMYYNRTYILDLHYEGIISTDSCFSPIYNLYMHMNVLAKVGMETGCRKVPSGTLKDQAELDFAGLQVSAHAQ